MANEGRPFEKDMKVKAEQIEWFICKYTEDFCSLYNNRVRRIVASKYYEAGRIGPLVEGFTPSTLENLHQTATVHANGHRGMV